MELTLRARTQGILARYNLRPRKGLSQHFLVEDRIFRKLIESADVQSGDFIFEVGGGLGLLTEALSRHGAYVLTVEVDKTLCNALSERFQGNPRVGVVCENILRFNPHLHFKDRKFKAVGNLPYHLSGAILRWFLNRRVYFSALYLMLQKEVAQRIVAAPRSKSYGVLSLLCQYFTLPEILFTIPPQAFLPPPKVESAFLKLIPKPAEWVPNRFFVPLVKQAFSQRRKTLYNNLKSLKTADSPDWKKIFEQTGIRGNERAEELPLDTFEKIASVLKGRAGTKPETFSSCLPS